MQIRYAATALFGAAAAGIVAYALSGNGTGTAPAVSAARSAPDRVVVQLPAATPPPATGGELPDQSAREEIASLKAQLEKLRREVHAEMRALDERSADRAAFADAATETAYDPTTDTPEAAKEREERAIDTFADHFDAVLAGEAVDVAGSGSRRDEIATYIASHGLASSRLDAVDCSQSLCRMVVHHDGGDDPDAFVDLVGDGPLSAGSFYYQSDDGRETVVYVALPGHEERFNRIMQSASQTLRP